MNRLQVLRDVLRQHGFKDAADDPDFRPGPDALDSWQDYPACMGKYPEYLIHKRDEEGNIVG